MRSRTMLAAASLLASVHCGGQAATGPDTGGPDGASPESAPPGSSGAGGSSGGSSGSSSGGGSSSGAAVDAGGDAGCLGLTAFDGGPRGTPAAHRPQAAACSASSSCGYLDGGGQACSDDAACSAPDGSYSPFTHCLHGQCAIDECLADSDCASGTVCSCSSAYYGGNGCPHPNLCVPANCHVDSDCGPGGFCAPTTGYCGIVEGFYCQKPTDPCVNAATDCACSGGMLDACVYAPTRGQFVCGPAQVCAG